MKFSIGDKVVLKHTGDEGEIIAMLQAGMVEVSVNGVSFPVYEDELDHPYLKWFMQQRVEQKRTIPGEELPVEKKAEQPRLPRGIYLSVFPDYVTDSFEDVVEKFRIFFLNELNETIRISYQVFTANGQELFRHSGTLHPFAHLYLHHLSLEEMSTQPRFHWQAESGEGKDLLEIKGQLRIRASKLYEQIREAQHNNQPSFSYLLADGLMPVAKKEITIQEPVAIPAIKEKKPLLPPPRYEIDLHANALSPKAASMTPAEILKLQLDTLEYYLHLAIVHHQQKMIVIHGLGEGKLREHVHKVLRKTPEILSFRNEWQGKYGFGATEITFRL